MNQDQLLARITEVLEQDPRILSAWLAGSRARGIEDQFSDIDVWLVVSDEDRDSFVDDWPKLSERISPTVLRQSVFSGMFTHVTPEWLRYDVSIGVPQDVPRRTRSTLKPLLDRAELTGRLKQQGEPLKPNPKKVEALITEFMRIMGLLPVVLGRNEYVVGVLGAGLRLPSVQPQLVSRPRSWASGRAPYRDSDRLIVGCPGRLRECLVRGPVNEAKAMWYRYFATNRGRSRWVMNTGGDAVLFETLREDRLHPSCGHRHLPASIVAATVRRAQMLLRLRQR